MPLKLFRVWPILFIGSGTALMFSALINVVSAAILFEPSDEAALGISRNEVMRWYVAMLIAGGLLVGLGVRRRRK